LLHFFEKKEKSVGSIKLGVMKKVE